MNRTQPTRTSASPRKGARRRPSRSSRLAPAASQAARGGERTPGAGESARATRRAFLRVLALAGTALAAGAAAPLAATTATTKKRASSATPAPSAAVRKEIENQKGYLAKQLRVIRDFALPIGSEPGFLFRPLSPRRRPGGK